MATIVVVQSDQLAAWVGLAGVVVGVVLTASIDTWRDRRRERQQRRSDLMRAGRAIRFSALQLAATIRAAGAAHEADPLVERAPWNYLLQARKDALNEAIEGIANSGSRAVIEASWQVMNVASRDIKIGDRQAYARRDLELATALDAYYSAVRAAKP